ncbi:MAG: YeiH family protein [Pseudomarimonas sp.]
MTPSIALANGPSKSIHPQRSFWLGLVLAGALALTAISIANIPQVRASGLSALTLAILLGIALGNSVFPTIAAHTGAGVDFSKAMLLRAGIVLYGLRVTFQDIASVGVSGITIAVLMVGSVFLLAVYLGTRVFKLDRETSMLIGAGSAICGAAAVMATQPVVRGEPHKVTVAVATVVVFGTLGMFLYPWLNLWFGLDEQAYGIYVGSTIHEVAQVVVAGKSVGEAAAATAVIEKMMRVMLLAPFLLIVSAGLQRSNAAASGDKLSLASIPIPWFALLFIAVTALNSTAWLSPTLVAALIHLDTLLLAMAMAALGLRTQFSAIRQAGARPMMLAASLFVFLTIGGLAINAAVTRLFA